MSGSRFEALIGSLPEPPAGGAIFVVPPDPLWPRQRIARAGIKCTGTARLTSHTFAL